MHVRYGDRRRLAAPDTWLRRRHGGFPFPRDAAGTSGAGKCKLRGWLQYEGCDAAQITRDALYAIPDGASRPATKDYVDVTSQAAWRLQADGITLVATHRVLQDVAHDLLQSWGEAGALARPVVLHVGAHRSERLADQGNALQIGIQTEQMHDEAGQKLWKAFGKARLSRMVQHFDLILDLSGANAPAYDALPPQERAKVRFGPWIFPSDPPPARPPGRGLLFVGAPNERRSRALEALGDRVVRMPDGTFGPAVARALEEAGGLLNLHYEDGVYSEYPRLLKAVLAGRAVWSERLAAPLVEGVHYFAPGERPDAGRIAAVQGAMAGLLCSRFALRSFVGKEIGA